jgi:RNA polymerase sigma factor (sigma-70 family)
MLMATRQLNDEMRELEIQLQNRPITPSVEQALGRLYTTGRAAKQQLQNEAASTHTTQELEQAVRAGEWALEQLVQANMPLVASIAKRYMGRGLDFEDLCQEGTIGLLRAIEGFDWNRGLRLSTYASWWIRQTIGRGVGDRGRLIRLPASAQDDLDRIMDVSQAIAEKTGRNPQVEEIAQATGFSNERVADLVVAMAKVVSLDTSVGPENRPVEDVIEDDSPGPEELACQDSVRNELDAFLAELLTQRECEVVRLRYGLVDGNTWSLEAIGSKIGVTRERARQLETAAMGKLRSNADVLKIFRGYLVAA